VNNLAGLCSIKL